MKNEKIFCPRCKIQVTPKNHFRGKFCPTCFRFLPPEVKNSNPYRILIFLLMLLITGIFIFYLVKF